MTHRVQPVAQVARQLRVKADYICQSCLFSRQQSIHIQRTTAGQQAQRLHTLSIPVRRRNNTQRLDVPNRCSIKNVQRRVNGSLASSTAINAPSRVPTKYQSLHDSLARLRDDAAAFVDLSRLQLAVKSLESDHPTLRIGFLSIGANGATTARRLARVLLSDPLGAEETWERELVESRDDGRSLLLRFGQVDDLAPANAAMRTMLIPSALLQKHNLEILITSFQSDLNAGQASPESIEDALLVPSLTIPAASGRVGFVRSPVHRSLVIAAGVDGAVQLGHLPLSNDGALVSVVVDIATSSHLDPTKSSILSTTNVDSATAALQNFRVDQASGALFGTAWLASNVPSIAAWLHDEPATHIVDRYVVSTLSAIERSIDTAEQTETENKQFMAIPQATRDSLQQAISTWSADAHNDLRNNLLTALESRAWRRTAWFRLLWRIDDVSYSSTDILNQCWLNETEQRLAFLSGRINQAGLASVDELKGNGSASSLVSDDLRSGVKALEHGMEHQKHSIYLARLPLALSRLEQHSGINPLFDPPWPQTINLARQLMLHTNVPDMHRKAQGLVLSTMSTVGATTALGAWLLVASSGVALYEAGAIAALGLVWSLRRLQKLWGKERDGFAVTVQENGRRVLVEIEDQLRQLVTDGGKSGPSTIDVASFTRARLAVEKCREVLRVLREQ